MATHCQRVSHSFEYVFIVYKHRIDGITLLHLVPEVSVKVGI